MAISLTCKKCGGTVDALEGEKKLGQCRYCDFVQPIPDMDDEKKAECLETANRLRLNLEYDRALSHYDTIIQNFPEEADGYWGALLCKYGIEYVKDPASHEYIPTCHRFSMSSVLEDPLYESACDYADVITRGKYREQARELERIRQQILEHIQKNEKYDVFICYKETDEYTKERTHDSVLAQDIYQRLTKEGYKTFFSRITLEDEAGCDYEAKIFAALNSAKVMLVVGTTTEHLEAVWVRNEWSRFLEIIAKDHNKLIIPCYRDMTAYDLPKEIQRIQGYDMGKVGAEQDLVYRINKLFGKTENQANTKGGVQNNARNFVFRGNMALEDGDYAKAAEHFENALNSDPKCAEAYMGKELCVKKLPNFAALKASLLEPLDDVRPEQIAIPEGEVRSELVAKYSVPGYFDPRKVLIELPTYVSKEKKISAILTNAERYFSSTNNLKHAFDYAVGQTATDYKNGRDEVINTLRNALSEEEDRLSQHKSELSEQYEARLEYNIEEIKTLSKRAEEARESDYTTACNNTDENAVAIQVDKLKRMGDYKDAPQRVERLKGFMQSLDFIKQHPDLAATMFIEKHREVADKYAQAKELSLEKPKRITPFLRIILAIITALFIIPIAVGGEDAGYIVVFPVFISAIIIVRAIFKKKDISVGCMSIVISAVAVYALTALSMLLLMNVATAIILDIICVLILFPFAALAYNKKISDAKKEMRMIEINNFNPFEIELKKHMDENWRAAVNKDFPGQYLYPIRDSF